MISQCTLFNKAWTHFSLKKKVFQLNLTYGYVIKIAYNLFFKLFLSEFLVAAPEY